MDLSAVLLVDMSWLQLCPSGGLDSLGRPFRREASPIGCSGSVSALQHVYFELCLCCRVGHAANSRGHARDKRMLIGHSYCLSRTPKCGGEQNAPGAVQLLCLVSHAVSCVGAGAAGAAGGHARGGKCVSGLWRGPSRSARVCQCRLLGQSCVTVCRQEFAPAW